jgi:DNA-binding transcriptional ArsR family regulator
MELRTKAHSGEGPDHETLRQAVKVFKALADATRYRIVLMLAERGELQCAELARAFPLSLPAMSHHYRVLEHAGLVDTRKAGSQVFFRLNLERLRAFVPGFASPVRGSRRRPDRGSVGRHKPNRRNTR